MLLFEHLGFQCAAAENGKVALDLLRGGLRPDVILLALLMPVMDGVDFRCAQLQDPALASLPTIIVATAAPIPGLTLGLPVLARPIRFSELRRALDQVGVGSEDLRPAILRLEDEAAS